MANEIIISSDSRPYKSLITDIGTAKMANAALEGRKVNIVEMHQHRRGEIHLDARGPQQ